MKIKVKVKPNAKQAKISTAENGSLVIWLRSPPVEGKANAELIKLLEKYYGIRRSQISILHGQTGRDKLVNIDLD